MKNRQIANLLAAAIHAHSRFHIRLQDIIKWLEQGNVTLWKKAALRLITRYVEWLPSGETDDTK